MSNFIFSILLFFCCIKFFLFYLCSTLNLFDNVTPMKIIAASDLMKFTNNSTVNVAGLVFSKQRPKTANGVVFFYLEDETGIINIVCWENIYNKYYREILSSKLILVKGRLQKESGTINIIAQSIKNISHLLKLLPYIDKPYL